MTDPVLAQNAWEHIQIFLSGSTVFVIVAHAVQTLPTPENKYAQWALGVAQFAVGQRLRAANTLAGEGTLTRQVPRDTVNPPAEIDAPLAVPSAKTETNPQGGNGGQTVTPVPSRGS